MSAPRTDGRRLPVIGTTAARVIGGAGALACVLCCVGIPSVVAAISAVGLGFLRNDRLLFPAEIVSIIIVVAALARSRARHGRNAPTLLGLASAAWMFLGLKTRAPLGAVAALTGALAVVAVIVWDWRLQKRCRT
jgi:mercuric ion transport protein